MTDENIGRSDENIGRSDENVEFVAAPPGDDTEIESHLTPASGGRSVNVPVGSWVDVRGAAGEAMVVAPGTYVDEAGVLRSSGDHSVVAWHIGADQRTGLARCRRGIPARLKPEEIIYDVNGAPWCPECYEDREQEREKKKIAAMFQSNIKEN